MTCLLLFIAIPLGFIVPILTMFIINDVFIPYGINEDIRTLINSIVGTIVFIAYFVSVYLGCIFNNLGLIILISMGIFIVHSAVSWFAVTPNYKTNINSTLHKIKL